MSRGGEKTPDKNFARRSVHGKMKKAMNSKS